MPKGISRKKKIEIPPEGWGRCADCIAKNYETWCYYLNDADSPQEVAKYEKIMAANEEIMDLYFKRSKAGTAYDPKEHTCICCDYAKEFKEDIESGKNSVVATKTEFKVLCKDYMKRYKKVSRIPITSRKSKEKIVEPKEEDDE